MPESSTPDLPGDRHALDAHAACASEIDRRHSQRRHYEGTILIIWHHRPQDPVRLHTVDVSECGARVKTTCTLPEGMTGTAVELLGAPGQLCEGATEAVDAGVSRALERHLIGRTVTVVWSTAIRRDDGRLDHFEAGLRFF